MRRLTKKEKEWKMKFENKWEDDESRRPSYRKDIMNKGVRYGSDFEEPIIMTQVDQCNKSTIVDNYVSRLLGNGHRGSAGDYSPADYYALPEQWFTHKWTDVVDKLVDRQRNRDKVFDSNIPGIVYKDPHWEVNRFFEGKSVMLGRFLSLEDAKDVLKEYNKKITKSGYGVDYN